MAIDKNQKNGYSAFVSEYPDFYSKQEFDEIIGEVKGAEQKDFSTKHKVAFGSALAKASEAANIKLYKIGPKIARTGQEIDYVELVGEVDELVSDSIRNSGYEGEIEKYAGLSGQEVGEKLTQGAAQTPTYARSYEQFSSVLAGSLPQGEAERASLYENAEKLLDSTINSIKGQEAQMRKDTLLRSMCEPYNALSKCHSSHSTAFKITQSSKYAQETATIDKIRDSLVAETGLNEARINLYMDVNRGAKWFYKPANSLDEQIKTLSASIGARDNKPLEAGKTDGIVADTPERQRIRVSEASTSAVPQKAQSEFNGKNAVSKEEKGFNK